MTKEINVNVPATLTRLLVAGTYIVEALGSKGVGKTLAEAKEDLLANLDPHPDAGRIQVLIDAHGGVWVCACFHDGCMTQGPGGGSSNWHKKISFAHAVKSMEAQAESYYD